MTVDPGVTYLRADLDRLELPAAAFALAYSSLALPMPRMSGGCSTACIAPSCRADGSCSRPSIRSSPRRPGWSTDAGGRRSWPVDGYLVEGPRRRDWLDAVVVKQHRTLGATLNALVRAGFAIARVEEFGPPDAQIAARPELAEERGRPLFVLVAARR